MKILATGKKGNKAVQEKISALIDDIIKHPYTGTGKPEALKYQLSGSWSRRITRTHRLVYSVNIENICRHPLIDICRKEYNLSNLDKQQSPFFPELTVLGDVRNHSRLKGV